MQRLLCIGICEGKSLLPALTAAGYETCVVAPEDAPLRDAFERFRPDALVLELAEDILLLQHVRRLLRAELNARPLPILALARRAHLAPAHLIVGVDDFLLPPYASEELLARIQMLFWRFQRVNTQHCIQADAMVLDLARRQVTIEGSPVALTQREFQLLQFLMTHCGRVFTREALLSQVWGYGFEGDVRVVDATIKRLRSRLPAPYADRIETVRSVGYRFNDSGE